MLNFQRFNYLLNRRIKYILGYYR